MTVGSLSMQVTGASLRGDAISLRDALVREASEKLGVSVADITIDGTTLEFHANGGQCSVFDLPTAEDTAVKSNDDGGSLASASTIADSILGKRQYIQDLVLPGMMFARALRGRQYTPKSTDAVRVIKDGGFSALLADSEIALDRAWAQVDMESVKRDTSCDGPVAKWIKQRRTETLTSGETSTIPTSNKKSVVQTATRPFLLHASIAPSCAIARYDKGVLEVWTHSQGIFPLRDTVARHLGMSVDKVIVRHVPSAGCYGHNAADDAAMDAVLISLQLEGVAVRVVWTREDDFQHSPVGAAMQVQIEAQLSDDNAIENWRQTIWSCPHGQRPGGGGNINLLAAIEQDAKNKTNTVKDLPEAIGGGASRSATPPYSIKSFGFTSHIVQDLPVRTSSIRGLGAQINVVCIEATINKLANSQGIDPLDFRLQHLEDPRGRNVLLRLKNLLDVAAPSLQENEGIGIGYSRYKGTAAFAAVATHLRLTDKVELLDVWSVVDAGYVVDRSGTLNQIEGGIIQAASWTLCEGVELRGGYIDAQGWDDYPIFGWSDIPKIHTTLLNEHSDLPYLGVGECMVGPTSAAIVNGVSEVAGCSMGDLPLTREKFLQAASAE